MGLCVTPIAVAGTSGVAREDSGLASGLLNSSRTIGASIGLAVLTTVAATRTASALHGVSSAAARLAVARTDGYALAIAVASVILLAAGASVITLPPFRRPARDAVQVIHARGGQPDEAFESA
jgi:hypothetical protein